MCRVNNSLRDVLSFKYTHEIGLAMIVKMQLSFVYDNDREAR